MIRGVLIAVLALAASAATGLEKSPEERRSRPREQIFRMVDEYIAANLQERVGLSDDQLARTLPLVRRLHGDRRHFAERRMRALHQMRRTARAGAVSDARAAQILQELKAAEAEEAAAIRAGQDAVDAVLTPAQQLKYRILETEIEHRLRALMARVRAQRRDGPGRHGGDGPLPESPAPR